MTATLEPKDLFCFTERLARNGHLPRLTTKEAANARSTKKAPPKPLINHFDQLSSDGNRTGTFPVPVVMYPSVPTSALGSAVGASEGRAQAEEVHDFGASEIRVEEVQ
jgi:hypothetical protein